MGLCAAAGGQMCAHLESRVSTCPAPWRGRFHSCWLNPRGVLTLGAERGSSDHLFPHLGAEVLGLPPPRALRPPPRWLRVMQAGDWRRGGEWEGAVSESQVQTGVCTPIPWSWGVCAVLPTSGGGVAGGDIPENMYATTWTSIGSFKAPS